ncbi:hypothetical protein BGX28_009182 [Mortierella sp. GBA30]|nr:hypothetical protein BGX28_009182 [Mortierella sp. GBA30]
MTSPGTSGARPTRSSIRSSTSSTSTSARASTKPNVKRSPTKRASAPQSKSPVKRRTAVSATGARKRAKQADSEDDDAPDDQDETGEDSIDDDDEDDYKDEDSNDQEAESADNIDDDDEDEDFESLNIHTRKGIKTPATSTKAKTSSKKATTITKKTPSSSSSKVKTAAINPDLLPAPSKTFEISTLKIPHPANGPVADAIQPETLEFIRDLKLNNDREYMMLNHDRCDRAKADFLDFIRMVKEGLLEADPDVMDQEPKDAMMRIYRDIRFSNDKSPYKRQFSCHFSRGGRKSIAAGYYFGVSSGGETFAGCGVWDPSGAVLSRIRQGIVNHSDRFEEILKTEGIRKITGGRTGVDALRPGSSQLKTGPAGYDKDHPMIEYLKRKCFAVGRHFEDKEVVSEGFLEKVLETFDACVDLVHILNEWIG